MILSAGLGTRLYPLTLYLPKPLFPVLNIPNIFRIFKQLEAAGFNDIVVNSYHLSDTLKNALNPFNVKLLIENDLLGTGGGIRNAMPVFDRSNPILLINADVVTDLDLRRIFRIHEENAPVASMLLHHHPPLNKVYVKDNSLTGFERGAGIPFAFTGISVLSSEFMKYLPEETPSSLIDAFRKAIDSGECILPIFAEELSNTYIWEDIGTIEGYLSAHKNLLKNEKLSLKVHPEAIVSEDLECIEWSCIGRGALIGKDVTIERCVIWEDSVVEEGANLKDQVVTPYGVLGIRA